MGTYKCFKSDFADLEKRTKTISRKLDKYGIAYEFKIISEAPELVPVYEMLETHRGKEMINRDPIVVDVVTYTFTMDKLQLGDYIPVAVLEHMDGANMVYMIDQTITAPEIWFTMSGYCEHCNSNRQRKKTVMLRDQKNGNLKQVGTSCLKEFTGIDAADVVGVYADISSIMLNDISYQYHKSEKQLEQKYQSTLDYLAKCIDIINDNGYSKGVKEEAFTLNTSATEKATEKAKEIIEFFTQFKYHDDIVTMIKTEYNSDFYWNIAIALKQQYSKISGFVAYAFLAYNQIKEIIKEIKETEETKKISEYQFNIKDKIDIVVTYVNCFRYEVTYGYYPTTNYIYIFRDNNGNVYKWNTSKRIDTDKEYGSTITITGTVKDHQEYNNEKQTVLTRCKIK